jgi:hypothetical protein
LGNHDTGTLLCGQLRFDALDFGLDVLEVLFLEGFVFEQCLLKICSDGFLQTFQILLKQLTIHDAVVEFAAELLETSEHLARHVVVVHVGLDLCEHLVVLNPILGEGGVLVDDQVNNIQAGQHLS